jgi:hypothetical protein
MNRPFVALGYSFILVLAACVAPTQFLVSKKYNYHHSNCEVAQKETFDKLLLFGLARVMVSVSKLKFGLMVFKGGYHEVW